MNLQLIKLYLIESVKLFFIFLFIRTLLDFGIDQNAFNLQKSLTNNLVAAGIFGLLLGVFRVLKFQQKRKKEDEPAN